MRVKEIRAMGAPELKEKLSELYKELMKDNAQVATGTVPKNPDKLHRSKKTIAQIKTILHEKANSTDKSKTVKQLTEAAKKA